MRCLLDTHTLLWFMDDNPRLSPPAKALIEADDSEAMVSIVSLWEVAIKLRLGKLSLSIALEDLFEETQRLRFALVPIEYEHVRQIARLPMHHRDPFDRMLVAQATHLNASLVSCDTAFDAYRVKRIW